MDLLIALIAGLAAVISAWLSTRASKRTGDTVTADGEATRTATVEVVTGAVEAVTARFDARVDDVRDDLDEVREHLTRVREWQAGHDAEHLIIGQPHPREEN